ncbi:MAG: YihY/virulence factor BrkB family protein [Bacteroidales bacterium]|jgi:membrane protein
MRHRKDLWTNLNKIGFLNNYFEKAKNRYPWWCQRTRLYDVLKNLISAMQNGFLNSRASAIAFQFLKALFPFILSLATVLPYLPIDQAVVLDTISDIFTFEATQTIFNVLHDFLSKPRVGLMSISFIYLLIATSRCISTIIMTLNNSFQTFTKRPWLITRMISLVFAFSLLILFIIVILLLSYQSIFVTSFVDLSTKGGKFVNVILEILRWILLLLTSISIVSLLYYYSPGGERVFKLVSPGAFVAVISIGVFVYLYKIYLANFSKFNYLYGSLGALIIFMIILNTSSIVLVFGFELNTAIGLARKKILSGEVKERNSTLRYGSRNKPVPKIETQNKDNKLSVKNNNSDNSNLKDRQT